VADDARFLVLHGLRLKGLSTADQLEDAWGLNGAAEHLAALVADGECAFRDAPASCGYVLSRLGRERHGELLRRRREGLTADVRESLGNAYWRFTPLNEEFKELCTSWQMRGSIPNDHSDAGYDAGCLSALEDLHARFVPLVRRASRGVVHLGRYERRFQGALDRLLGGDLDYFTKPFMDSYHTVWFEFHEDLLLTMGRERRPGDA
jgi:hypothetical protein